MPSQYVKGLDELLSNLKLLPHKMHNNVFKAGIRGAARAYIKESRKNLGPGYNTLKKSLKIKSRRSPKQRILMQVTPERGKNAKNDGWYAHIVEFGSFKHPGGWDITPWRSRTEKEAGKRISGKKALSLGANLVFSKTHHPPIKPTRFMSRAISNKNEMIDGLLKSARKNFAKQIKKNYG